MLKHLVLFRRRAGVPTDEVLEQSLFGRMVDLGPQIPVIRSWRVVANELQRPPVTWDYALECEVDDASSLTAYLTHPTHRALVQDLAPYLEMAAVDYTV
jgi:hypothetical protein